MQLIKGAKLTANINLQRSVKFRFCCFQKLIRFSKYQGEKLWLIIHDFHILVTYASG
jgi:hypothetical protein